MKTEVIDILQIIPQTIKVELLHPATGNPLGIKVECQSYQSEAVRQVQRMIQNKQLRSGRNNYTAEKSEADSRLILAAAIVNWEWPENISLGSITAPSCTSETKEILVSQPWAFQQLDQRISDESAFFKK